MAICCKPRPLKHNEYYEYPYEQDSYGEEYSEYEPKYSEPKYEDKYEAKYSSPSKYERRYEPRYDAKSSRQNGDRPYFLPVAATDKAKPGVKAAAAAHNQNQKAKFAWIAPAAAN